MRKTTSLIGSSGIVGSAAMILEVSVSTKVFQSVRERRYSGSFATGRGDRVSHLYRDGCSRIGMSKEGWPHTLEP